MSECTLKVEDRVLIAGTIIQWETSERARVITHGGVVVRVPLHHLRKAEPEPPPPVAPPPLTMQRILEHLCACVADMNADQSHSLATLTQGCVGAIATLQDKLAEYGYLEGGADGSDGHGDWHIGPTR